MQSQRLCVSFGSLLHYYTKIFVFAIVCGFIVGQVSTQYHGNPDDIVFDGPINSRSNDRAQDNEPADFGDNDNALISLSLASRLNSIETSEEFMQLLQGVPEHEKEPTLSTGDWARYKRRFFTGRFGVERSNAIMPMQAKCMPELQTVPLKLDNSLTIIFPSCTRIKRCGGCCSNSLLSCQPTNMEIRNFEVIVASLELNYKGREIVPVEEHTMCKCECRIKEEDCNEKQRYDMHNCMCMCNNIDEEEKCQKSNGMKIWKKNLCVCTCRTIEPCTTGYYFNYNTCRCGPITLSRPVNRSVSTKGSNYDFSNHRPPNVPPMIVPLDPMDPRRKHKEDPEY